MDKEYYAEKGLVVGIASIIFGFYFFSSTLFTFKSSLIEQTGKIENLETYYRKVESSRGSKSIKSELEFKLNSTQSIYILMKNIGQSRRNYRFEKLKKQLEKSKIATVWIKRNQKDEYEPTVFQIADKSGEILYDFEESKSHSKFGFLISLSLGIFGIGLYLKHKFWKKPTHNTV
ncbi:hypothetical protein [Polaribacter sp. Asnod6-C07]|uniref:hypothetical protein n=1 Tax=Polaribacter sp. Asnod6-C07 TaxID=3160582 RepID=UPI00386F99BA